MEIICLDPQIEKELNEQIRKEHQAAMTYLSMAVWAEINNYPGTASFFYQQSSEEREHMLKIVRYLTNLERTPVLPTTEPVNQHYDGLQKMLSEFLRCEQLITKAIHRIVDTTIAKKDHATFQFLQWFVAEQQEEEAVARKALDLCEVMPPDGFGRYAIDQAISKLHSTSA